MGNSSSNVIPETDFSVLASQTHFTANELSLLHAHFYTLTSSTVDEMEWLVAMGLRNSLWSQRIFTLINPDRSEMTFEQFVQAVSVFSPHAPLKEKLRFSFSIFDADSDGFISYTELLALAEAAAAELPGTPAWLPAALVEGTISRVASSERGLNFQDYCEVVAAAPGILRVMSISFPSSERERCG